jgi:hypothetical protein
MSTDTKTAPDTTTEAVDTKATGLSRRALLQGTTGLLVGVYLAPTSRAAQAAAPRAQRGRTSRRTPSCAWAPTAR